MEKQKTNLNRESAKLEVNKVLNTMMRSQEYGNWEAFESCFLKSDEVVHIGTDIDEIWSDWNSFKTWMKMVFNQKKGTKITEKETKISVSSDGKVAWYSQLIDTCLETKSEPTRIEGFRHTGVLEFINNKWLIVQSHISAPILEGFNLNVSHPDEFHYPEPSQSIDH